MDTIGDCDCCNKSSRYNRYCIIKSVTTETLNPDLPESVNNLRTKYTYYLAKRACKTQGYYSFHSGYAFGNEVMFDAGLEPFTSFDNGDWSIKLDEFTVETTTQEIEAYNPGETWLTVHSDGTDEFVHIIWTYRKVQRADYTVETGITYSGDTKVEQRLMRIHTGLKAISYHKPLTFTKGQLKITAGGFGVYSSVGYVSNQDYEKWYAYSDQVINTWGCRMIQTPTKLWISSMGFEPLDNFYGSGANNCLAMVGFTHPNGPTWYTDVFIELDLLQGKVAHEMIGRSNYFTAHRPFFNNNLMVQDEDNIVGFKCTSGLPYNRCEVVSGKLKFDDNLPYIDEYQVIKQIDYDGYYDGGFAKMGYAIPVFGQAIHVSWGQDWDKNTYIGIRWNDLSSANPITHTAYTNHYQIYANGVEQHAFMDAYDQNYTGINFRRIQTAVKNGYVMYTLSTGYTYSINNFTYYGSNGIEKWTQVFPEDRNLVPWPGNSFYDNGAAYFNDKYMELSGAPIDFRDYITDDSVAIDSNFKYTEYYYATAEPGQMEVMENFLWGLKNNIFVPCVNVQNYPDDLRFTPDPPDPLLNEKVIYDVNWRNWSVNYDYESYALNYIRQSDWPETYFNGSQ